MLTISINTKIAAILKQHPDALEAIVSISPRFEKLRNPILRKLIAGRASIGMASKMGDCSSDAFFEKLKPLGFKIDASAKISEQERQIIPDFIKNLDKKQLISIDVRPLIASSEDPLKIITEKVKELKTGQVLKIINSFEPVPLILLLEKQGFEVYADTIHKDLVETYFFKQNKTADYVPEIKSEATSGWDSKLEKFKDDLQTIDVRKMEMPMPMLSILDALDNLSEDKALFVYHKRIPIFLLPELESRKFEYRIKEISDGEVHMLIFKS